MPVFIFILDQSTSFNTSSTI